MKKEIQFSHSTVTYYFGYTLKQFQKLAAGKHVIILTDRNIARHLYAFLQQYPHIIIRAGEKYKQPDTVTGIIAQLIKLGADKNSLLIGVGGGVVTDIAGYTASIYMRGIQVGFIPTSLLAMTDASVGGKNGVDIGIYKNMAGTIRQPSFLFYAPEVLRTLPLKEWRNGFAEIIKHAAILDAPMFKALENHSINDYRANEKLLEALVRRNALLKTKLVQEDEFEQGPRKLLNFGHTLGHALENLYELAHGEAISIGMHYAAKISDTLYGTQLTERLSNLLTKYGLPTTLSFDKNRVFKIMLSDKKRKGDTMQYVLLQGIGKGVTERIAISDLKKIFGKI